MRFSLAKLLIVVSIVAIGLGAFVGYRSYFQSHQTGASAAVANRMIWPVYRLPATASDVTYYADFGGCEAEFAISESHFIDWCESRGWVPKPIKAPVAYFQPVLLPTNDHAVTKGFTFDIPDGRGVFDAKRSRAAFWVSTFP